MFYYIYKYIYTKICPYLKAILLLIPNLEWCDALRPWGRDEENGKFTFGAMEQCKECGTNFKTFLKT